MTTKTRAPLTFLLLVFSGINVELFRDQSFNVQAASSTEPTTTEESPSAEVKAQETAANHSLNTCSFHLSYTCADHARCESKEDGTFDTCVCNPGYEGDGFKNGTRCTTPRIECDSQDTCTEFNRDCVNRSCICKTGFVEVPEKKTCEDINECLLTGANRTCDVNANCQNSPGSYTCTCKNKYEGDGKTCKYVCSVNKDCHPNASCKNGKCICDSGYHGDGKDVCADINECEDKTQYECDINAKCENLVPSYKCICNPGYFGDGKTCKEYPRTCHQILLENPKAGSGKYKIDPDGPGNMSEAEVQCQMRSDGLGLTVIEPNNPSGSLRKNTPETVISYKTSVPFIEKVADISGFCYQYVKGKCLRGAAILNGYNYWMDRSYKKQFNWGGAVVDGKCTCGQLGFCKTPLASCNCDGSSDILEDDGKNLDKDLLPVISIHMNFTGLETVKTFLGPVVCGIKPFDFPKDCDDAKFNLKVKKDGPYVIDIDGDGDGKPVLVYCDMESYPHVGVTQIPHILYTPISLDIPQTVPVTYTIDKAEIKKIMENSKFCRQEIKYDCLNSALSGSSYFTLDGVEKFDFPGSMVDGQCLCGVTGSCDDPSKPCNCDILDGKNRSDIGVIYKKDNLAVAGIKIATVGIYASFTISHLKCSQQEFGFEASCEPLLFQRKQKYSYTYVIDADGPADRNPGNKVSAPPFPVQCIMKTGPEYAITIVHHEQEKFITASGNVFYAYKAASSEQLKALTERSVYCTQAVEYTCTEAPLFQASFNVSWFDMNGNQHHYLSGVNGTGCSCAETRSCLEGGLCNCDSNQNSKDSSKLKNKYHLPVKHFKFAEITGGTSAQVQVGALMCYEVYPTCSHIHVFMKERLLMSEFKSKSGERTIDPDGEGGVAPFVVTCKYPQTIINISPDHWNKTQNPGGSEAVEQCFDLVYENGVTKDQIKALIERSEFCTQHLIYACQNAPKTDHVYYETCDGKKVPGWGGSKGVNKCACGVTGACAGPLGSSCNCDLEDGKTREDSGWIHDKQYLAACRVCIKLDPLKPGITSRSATYRASNLMCNSRGIGLFPSCQARRNARIQFSGTEMIDPDGNSKGNPPFPVYCGLSVDPPFATTEIRPKKPVYEPDPNGIVIILYFVYNLEYVWKLVKKSNFCEQEIYVLCGNAELPAREVGAKMDDWIVTKQGISCREGKCMCTGNEVYGGFVKDAKALPVGKVTLPTGSNGKVAVKPLGCFDLYKTCHEIREKKANKNPLGNNRYAIDPDGSGNNAPFGVTCDYETSKEVGITVVKTGLPAYITVKGKIEPGSYPINVTYPDTTPDQINALGKVSNFCSQGIEYECVESPLIQDNNPAASFYTGYQGRNSSSFGTGDASNVTGCSCVMTGTCETGNCQCDAKGPMTTIDYGLVTDTLVLPVEKVTIGGQTTDAASGKLKVTNVRCAPEPFDLPKNCEEVYKRGYRLSGSYVIWPSKDVKYFWVYCDLTTIPSHGITIIRNDRETPTKVPLDGNTETTVKVTYTNVDADQIAALTKVSKNCYQSVKYDCYNTLFLGSDKFYWTGKEGQKFKYFGDSNSAAGKCSCGTQTYCGGNQTKAVLEKRKCNCDAGETQLRSDAGTIKNKDDLAVMSLTFLPLTNRVGVAGNITVGKLYCAEVDYDPNECKEGFNDCHGLATCDNTKSTYECACTPGFQGGKVSNLWANGRNCYDDNECLMGLCPLDRAECINTFGTFQCICHKGYTQVDATTCTDINECEIGTHNCSKNARCINMPGSFMCRCNRGYEGDGYECTSVGLCSCFGDPHCLSFDGKWLHYQGTCQYTMARDGCNQTAPTFQVLTKHWQQGLQNLQDASWVEEVTIILQEGMPQIKLMQKYEVRIADITTDLPVVRNHFTIKREGIRIKVETSIGLIVYWDGHQAVEVRIPSNYQEKTCGLCGNYNLKPADDWTIGPACEDKGKITDNPNVFGNSYVDANYSAVYKHCAADCFAPDPKPPCTDKQQAIAKLYCDRLFLNDNFQKCFAKMDKMVIDGYRYSCYYDMCRVADFDVAVCKFADQIVKECKDNYAEIIKEWRSAEFCNKDCGENMEYLYCVTKNQQETCLEAVYNVTVPESTDSCIEGCFCKSGYLMAADKCVKRDTCGCYYNKEYFANGRTLVQASCSEIWTCDGVEFTKAPYSCDGNATCTTKNGKYGCHCNEGFMGDGTKCVYDPCGTNPCAKMANAKCVRTPTGHICQCEMGYTGDCNNCQDIDECKTQTHKCPPNSVCRNTVGSYTCNCYSGLVMNNGRCEDINECSSPILNTCGKNEECVDKLATFVCKKCEGYDIAGKCCACEGRGCKDDRPVCGTDGKTYASTAALKIDRCKRGLKKAQLDIDYIGECKETCSGSGLQCDLYKECIDDPQTRQPTCRCKPCNITALPIVMQNQLCDKTRLIVYPNLCRFYEIQCEYGFTDPPPTEDMVPCEGKGGLTIPVGDWGEWSPCSTTCGLGKKSRARLARRNMTEYEEAAFPLNVTANCFNPVCIGSPCVDAGCTKEQVCIVNNTDNTASCECPDCVNQGKEPVCARINGVNRDFDNECEAKEKACNESIEAFEILNKGKCGVSPVNCSRMPNFITFNEKNSAGFACKSEKLNRAMCEGGCGQDSTLCCQSVGEKERTANITCEDGSTIQKTYKEIEKCECKKAPKNPAK